jgi:hypothetical protein
LPAKLGALSRAMANRFLLRRDLRSHGHPIHDTIAAISDWIDRWIVEGFASVSCAAERI